MVKEEEMKTDSTEIPQKILPPPAISLFDYIHGDWTLERLEAFLRSRGRPLDTFDPLYAKSLLGEVQTFVEATTLVLDGLSKQKTDTPEIRQALQVLSERWGGMGHRSFRPSDDGTGIEPSYSGMITPDSQAQQVLLEMLALLEQGRPDHEILEPLRRNAADYRWTLQHSEDAPWGFLRMLHILLVNQLVGLSALPGIDLERCAYQPCRKFFIKLSQHREYCSKSCKEKASRFGQDDQSGRKGGRTYRRRANGQPQK
jgi:hypothetical protein